MSKTYADLHLCVDLRNQEKTGQLVKKAAKLGYRVLGVPLSPQTTEEEKNHLQSVCKEIKVDLVSRIDLKPKTAGELLNNLRKFRRRLELIAVFCESKNVARQAAKDRRVDLLSFPSLDFRKRFFDMAEAELASNALASLEIDVNPILVLEGQARIRLLSSLRRETAIANAFNVPIVLSSGASDTWLQRRPTDLAALASLFDLDRASAIRAVSTNAALIMKRNRQKLDSRFVAPGIRIIRRGKDC
jgi:RNase P/RNase MRP subunit p30